MACVITTSSTQRELVARWLVLAVANQPVPGSIPGEDEIQGRLTRGFAPLINFTGASRTRLQVTTEDDMPAVLGALGFGSLSGRVRYRL